MDGVVEQVERVKSHVTWMDSVVKRVKRGVSYVKRMECIVEQSKASLITCDMNRRCFRVSKTSRITCDIHSSPSTICYRTFKSFYENEIGDFAIVLILRNRQLCGIKDFNAAVKKSVGTSLLFVCFLLLGSFIDLGSTLDIHSLLVTILWWITIHLHKYVLQCAAMCCCVLQSFICCPWLSNDELQSICTHMSCSVLQCVAGAVETCYTWISDITHDWVPMSAIWVGTHSCGHVALLGTHSWALTLSECPFIICFMRRHSLMFDITHSCSTSSRLQIR